MRKTKLLLTLLAPALLFAQTTVLPTNDLNTTKSSGTTVTRNDSLVSTEKNQITSNPSDARLESLSLDNVKLENFKKDTCNYLYYLPYSATSALNISVVGLDSLAKVTVTAPSDIKGILKERTALVKVTSQDGSSSKTYSVVFEVLPKLDIFLALGQSNMAGRGKMTPADTSAIQNVYLLTPGGNLEIASNPLNKYSSIRKALAMQQMSPSCSFVKMIRDRTGHKIGLMQNARGGSSIESWLKGSPDKYYDEALRRALEIKKFGEIKGIIWHQGESNMRDLEGYKLKLTKLVNDLRTDLGMSHLYFLAGEINQWSGSTAGFNAMIQTISTFIFQSDWVSSEGLTPLIDEKDPHFNAASVKTLGERYAEKVLKKVYKMSSKTK